MRDPGLGFAACAMFRAGVVVGPVRWVGAVALCGAWACASSSAPPSAVPVAGAVTAVTPDRNVASSYHAPPGCPTQGDYVQYVESRSLKLRLFAEPAAVETNERVRVRIQPDTDTAGWRGALVIEGPTPLEREVRGERCEDVVLALALITVLRLEPNRESEAPGAAPPGATALAATGNSGTATAATASSATSAAPSTAPSETSATPGRSAAAPGAPPAASAAASAAAAASPGATAEPPPAPAEPLPVPGAAPGAAASAAAAGAVGSGAVGAGASGATAAAATEGAEAALAETAFAPDAAVVTTVVSDRGPTVEESNAPPFLVEPALAAYAGYSSSPSHAFQAMLRGEARFGPGRQAWAAAASLSYAHSSQKNSAVDLGFDSLLAGLALCPPGLTLSRGLWLEACAEARGGVLAVSVTERELPLDVDSGPRPWLDIGPSLQAGLPLSSRWTLRALTSVALVLIRDSFVVQRVVVDEDGQEQPGGVFTLYRPPAVSFQLLLGVGYQL